MTIQPFELHLISHNPWQVRALDAVHAASLAADIAEHGLLAAPVGRIHPDRPEYIQLAAGHHRLQAFRLLRQKVFDARGPNTTEPAWAALPVDVRELTDLQMATIAIAENHARKDLSAIEKAQTLQRLIAEFHLTQADAGQPFGLSQSAVAQLLRLLKLPEPIQAHVQAGHLPERLARQLVAVAKIFPAEALSIAEVAAKADPDAREGEFDSAREELYRAKGQSLHGIPWKLEWPKVPIKVEGHKSLSEIPACAGCEFFHQAQYGGNECLRRECLAQKHIEHAWTTVAAGSKKAGVPAGVRGSGVVTDLIGIGADEKYLERVLKSKHASLVVVPAAHAGDWRADHNREEATGSKWLTVATTDPAALALAVPKPKEQPKAKAAPVRDWKAEQAERQAVQKQVSALFDRATPYLARALPFGDAVVRLLWEPLDEYGLFDKFKAAKTSAERASLFVQALLYNKSESYRGDDELADARGIVAEVAKAFQAKLPAGWDQAAEPAPAARPAPKKKPSAPARAATAAAVSLAAKGGGGAHVRGHTRPAPKPSAAKTTQRKIAKKGSSK